MTDLTPTITLPEIRSSEVVRNGITWEAMALRTVLSILGECQRDAASLAEENLRLKELWEPGYAK